MIWEDMILQKIAANDELRNVFSKIFRLSKKDIKVINSIDQFKELNNNTKIVCLKSVIKNKQMRLEIHILDDTILSGTNKYVLLQEFSKLIGCYIVISGDSINPYEATKITENGEIIKIEFDVEIYD